MYTTQSLSLLHRSLLPFCKAEQEVQAKRITAIASVAAKPGAYLERGCVGSTDRASALTTVACLKQAHFIWEFTFGLQFVKLSCWQCLMGFHQARDS